MKKLWILLLVLTFAVLPLSVSAAGELSAAFSVSGDTVTVTAGLAPFSGALGVEATVSFDPEVLTLTSATVNAEGWVTMISGDRLVAYSDDQTQALSGGSVLTLTFKRLAASSEEQKTTVGLSAVEDDLGRTSSASCEVTLPGTGCLGDLNGDGTVNSDDLTLLARHVARIDTLEGTFLQNADVDGSGSVDAQDLTKMARYVARIITSWDQP